MNRHTRVWGVEGGQYLHRLLYLSLLSYLTQVEDLAAEVGLGLFSYGSGAVAELFSGTTRRL